MSVAFDQRSSQTMYEAPTIAPDNSPSYLFHRKLHAGTPAGGRIYWNHRRLGALASLHPLYAPVEIPHESNSLWHS